MNQGCLIHYINIYNKYIFVFLIDILFLKQTICFSKKINRIFKTQIQF